MSKFFYKGRPMKKPEHNSPGFEVQKTVRLGTDKAPARISVQTEERKQELIKTFTENGWASIIDVKPEQDEDIRDLEILLERPQTAKSEKQANRNDPCPCGSGKKYKKCCALN